MFDLVPRWIQGNHVKHTPTNAFTSNKTFEPERR